MSKLRPEMTSAKTSAPAPDVADSFYMIRDAVRAKKELIHGQLHAHGESCAIGAFFDANPKLALKMTVVDEVAAYNDSIPPTVSNKVRRRRVLAWLNWKLAVLANKSYTGKPL